MTDLRTVGRRKWRDHLTPEEKRELVRLDKIISEAERMAEVPRMQRARIQNRATVRAGK